tara:strand:- start:6851 stop:7147 length:297 start_codon:yes stop_codon:yes gene_type:complete
LPTTLRKALIFQRYRQRCNTLRCNTAHADTAKCLILRAARDPSRPAQLEPDLADPRAVFTSQRPAPRPLNTGRAAASPIPGTYFIRQGRNALDHSAGT